MTSLSLVPGLDIATRHSLICCIVLLMVKDPQSDSFQDRSMPCPVGQVSKMEADNGCAKGLILRDANVKCVEIC